MSFWKEEGKDEGVFILGVFYFHLICFCMYIEYFSIDGVFLPFSNREATYVTSCLIAWMK